MQWRSGWWAGAAAAILALAYGCRAEAVAHEGSGLTGSLTWAGSHGMLRVRRAVTGTKVVACATSLGCVVVRTD
jgi:hypothetical protein